MLKALYDYAVKNNLSALVGMSERSVKAYISLDRKGRFLGFVPAAITRVSCPDIGSGINGSKSNVIIEKAEIVLDISEDNGKSKVHIKHEFYMESLRALAEYEPYFKMCFEILRDDKCLNTLRAEFDKTSFTLKSPVGFMIDGAAIERDERVYSWWMSYRKSLAENVSATKMRCFITGELAEPLRIIPKISGLYNVGGHGSGDTWICCHKGAFCSYGLKQGYNCAVSEEAAALVNAALEKLLRNAPVLAGMKLVIWQTDAACNEENNPVDLLMHEHEIKPGFTEDICESVNNRAESFFDSIYKGTLPENIKKCRYHIVPVSGVGGRVRIHGYSEAKGEELCDSISRWYNELRLVSSDGKRLCKFPKLFTVLSRMLIPKSNENKVKLAERISSELGVIPVKFLEAIVENTHLADTIANRALNYIRTDILNSIEKSPLKFIDEVSCQILKVWLIRKGKIDMCESLNKEYTGTAYHIGRLVAVFGAIQHRANPGVNVSVVERYFHTASMTPGAVIGKLASLSNHHLAKLSEGENIYFRKLLQEVSMNIPLPLPKSMNITAQSEFALGYYQQCAKMYEKKDYTRGDKENGDR